MLKLKGKLEGKSRGQKKNTGAVSMVQGLNASLLDSCEALGEP